jgi:hypothetical protein
MKPMNIRKIILTATMASAAAFSFSASAENGINAERDSVENRTTPPDRNITNPNIEGYSASETAPIVESAEIDHEGVVHFEPNSVTLTQQAEGQLKQLVEQLDKNKPVSLTVDMQQGYDANRVIDGQQSHGVQGSKDSSAGYPATGEGMAGRTDPANPNMTPDSTRPMNNAQARDAELENRAELIANYRVESIRLYLQEKGIEVVEWNLEGQPSSFSGTQLSEATNSPTGHTGQLQDLEDVQEVRIVVIGEIRPEGLSSL